MPAGRMWPCYVKLIRETDDGNWLDQRLESNSFLFSSTRSLSASSQPSLSVFVSAGKTVWVSVRSFIDTVQSSLTTESCVRWGSQFTIFQVFFWKTTQVWNEKISRWVAWKTDLTLWPVTLSNVINTTTYVPTLFIWTHFKWGAVNKKQKYENM